MEGVLNMGGSECGGGMGDTLEVVLGPGLPSGSGPVKKKKEEEEKVGRDSDNGNRAEGHISQPRTWVAGVE